MDVQKAMSFTICNCSLPRISVKHTSERGFTGNELLVLLAVVMVIVGLAVPGILRVRAQARNQAFAVKLLRTIAASQIAYSKSCGSGGYAVDFTALRRLAPNSERGFIPFKLSQAGSLRRSGYDFTLDAGAGAAVGPLDCHGKPTQTTYLATAQPATFGIAGTGNRSFAITDKRIIWQTRSAAAPDEPFAEPAVPLQ